VYSSLGTGAPVSVVVLGPDWSRRLFKVFLLISATE
jgi:hypothetical protein